MAAKEVPVFPANAAADEVERIANLYRPMVELQEKLRNVGSLDDVIAARKAERERLDEDLGRLRHQKAQAEADKAASDEAAENFVRQRNREADAQLADARAQAETIVEEAKAQGERILKDARASLDKLHADIEAAKVQRAAMREENTAESTAFNAERQKRQNELDELNGKIAAARDQIAKLLGGA